MYIYQNNFLMPTECIPFRATNYFSSLICDYLDEAEELTSLYHKFPKIEAFNDQIEEKRNSFSKASRKNLVTVLKKQYQALQLSKLTEVNINNLNDEKTFTITTGHQLNLFTGPLYFLYKIISTVNLCEELKRSYPTCNFVPIYWMATEDHDFEEINFFNFKGDKIKWDRSFGGAVGELSTVGLDAVFEEFSSKLGPGKNAQYLRELFQEAYLKHENLSDATRYLVNELFGALGLVIIDANDKDLKRSFVPYVKQELTEKISYTEVSKTIKSFPDQYKIQVNPREINLFYIVKGARERIIEQEGKYVVNNTSLQWSKNEFMTHLEEFPERFSPNVLLRPLYQEVILPNLCYIGGGGELAYWLELKSTFEVFKAPFPMLLLRNSVLVINELQQQKLDKLNLNISELFLKKNDLLNKRVKELSEITIDFTPQMEYLKEQFQSLYKIATLTDKSFTGAVAAQERKQLKGLEHLEKRLLKAQKRKMNGELDRVASIQKVLFPNGSLQERNMNFSELYLEFGKELIPMLKKELQPLHQEFLIIS